MDNRITKKRLSDLLSYDWILIIVVAVAAIILMELLFTFTSVRTTEGQRFNYFYDENVSSDNDGVFIETVNRNNLFSFDIKEISSEALTSDYNVLSVRLSTYDGDVIFTDTFDSGEEGASVRAKTIIDGFKMFTFGDDTDEESILYNAKKYLSGFLADGKTDVSDYANLDENKISENFNVRAGERVYRNDINAGLISVKDEYARIKKLCEEVAYFQKVLDYDKTRGDDSIFYSYKRFEQAAANGEEVPTEYEQAAPKNYGINLTKLGEKARNTFYVRNKNNSAAVVVLAFDFKAQIPDLQYETLSFINAIIRNYADFADLL